VDIDSLLCRDRNSVKPWFLNAEAARAVPAGKEIPVEGEVNGGTARRAAEG